MIPHAWAEEKKVKAHKHEAHDKGHKSGLQAHVHGKAQLTIALENATNATIELEAPGESIVGFEHHPSNAQEKKASGQALSSLKERGAEMIVFSPDSKCTLKNKKAVVEFEEHHEVHHKKESHEAKHSGVVEAEHSGVEVEYELSCQKAVSGTEVVINFGKFFPKLKTLNVQILQDKSQSSKDLDKAIGKIKL